MPEPSARNTTVMVPGVSFEPTLVWAQVVKPPVKMLQRSLSVKATWPFFLTFAF